jgi:16S rRNA (guanine966-N2)-methyltransferase
MRLTGGVLRGKVLRFPHESKERPTSDFLREALFNILGAQGGKTFLDLFAGSGIVGVEAASRGAEKIFLIEKNKSLAAVIEKNIDACGFHKKCFVINKDIEKGLSGLFKKKCTFDIIFADPPYNRSFVSSTLVHLNKYKIYHRNSLMVIQHSVKENIVEFPECNYYLFDQRKYGENVLTFLKWRIEDAG